jgi:hypothetical protein|uniref:hypothetical protein n=1 Tax=Thecamoeba quadrilineata TaxID=343530 RepID=UPI00226CA5AB|nr:hypothetical protein OYV93_mgp15 [Thecamoeba quadrilineata]UZN43847.1 hypothetical protein [Thecamoeba quadrilineata]
MLIKEYYNNILRKDLILKVFPIDVKNIPEIEKLEIRIIFPKIIDDFSQVFDGIIYLEELTGQFPIKQILSIKRVGAQDYERSVLIKVTLRKERIYNFILYLTISLLFYWEESKNILLVKASADPKNKIVQLSHKEFFYFFNMPIEYDDRQFEWNLQFLFHFYNFTDQVNTDVLNYFLSHYIPYALYDVKKNKREIFIEQEESDN